MDTTNLPTVGTPASYYIGSDCHACTVVEVSRSGHRVVTRDAVALLTSGSICSEEQKYEHTADPEGAECVFTRRQDGTYRPVGGSYGRLNLDGYRTYRDPSY